MYGLQLLSQKRSLYQDKRNVPLVNEEKERKVKCRRKAAVFKDFCFF